MPKPSGRSSGDRLLTALDLLFAGVKHVGMDYKLNIRMKNILSSLLGVVMLARGAHYPLIELVHLPHLLCPLPEVLVEHLKLFLQEGSP